MNLEERLTQCIENGEIIEIKYYGGSNPGKNRSIVPIKIDNSKLTARCLQTNAVKTFSINKISLIEKEAAYLVSDGVIENLELSSIGSIQELYSMKKDKLESMGWVIQIDETCLSLHKCFKNGKVRKSAEVALSYNEYVFESIYNIETDTIEEIKGLSTRPFCLHSSGANTKTYSNFSKAVESFMEVAWDLRPADNEI